MTRPTTPIPIIPLQKEDQKAVRSLFRAVTISLQRQGIRQWDRLYPNRFVIGNDLTTGSLYGLALDGRIVAAVTVDAKQSPKYAALSWADSAGNPACIHRLAVLPEYQGQGLGKRLLQFAESLAGRQGHTSIRLDVYTGNPGAVGMYRKADYEPVGEVHYPFRKQSYLCFEKMMR